MDTSGYLVISDKNEHIFYEVFLMKNSLKPTVFLHWLVSKCYRCCYNFKFHVNTLFIYTWLLWLKAKNNYNDIYAVCIFKSIFSLFWVVWVVCSPPYIIEPVIKRTVEVIWNKECRIKDSIIVYKSPYDFIHTWDVMNKIN